MENRSCRPIPALKRSKINGLETARRVHRSPAMDSAVDISSRAVAPARIVLMDSSLMKDEALRQLAMAASLPGCVRAVAMPDLHPGRGIPVGASFAFQDSVYPHLIGGDAGCGARVVCTRFDRVSRERVERRLRRAFAEDSPSLAGYPLARWFEAVWSRGPRGLLEVGDVPDLLQQLCLAEPPDDDLPRTGTPSPLDASAGSLLGTIGGGNHFAEVSLVESVTDPEMARQLGISRGTVTVLAHSGSRGVGERLARRWGTQQLRAEELDRFVADLAGACRFARANRLVLAWKLLTALGATNLSDISGQFDVTHNDVRAEMLDGVPVWVHRKGAAPAHQGMPTVVLGSRGAPSYVMVGQGSESSLRSVAHGAGRRMSRHEARWKLSRRYRKEEISRSPVGGRILCEDRDLLYEEHPDVYKPVERVVGAVEDADAAYRVASLVPVITVKL